MRFGPFQLTGVLEAAQGTIKLDTTLKPLFLIGFLTASAFIAYTVVGYPLILGWIARRFGRPIARRFEPRSVSFIIAVHNGANFLAEKLRSILALDYPRELMEILVVSDASTDSTDDIARSFNIEGVQLIRVSRGGKPAALNAAVPRTSGEILVLTDVRQVLERESLRPLNRLLWRSHGRVLLAEISSFVTGSVEETNVGLYWRYERWVRKQLGRVDSMMGATGPFYAIRSEPFSGPCPTDYCWTTCISRWARFSRDIGLSWRKRLALSIIQPMSRRSSGARCGHLRVIINCFGIFPNCSAGAIVWCFTIFLTRSRGCCCLGR